MLVFTRKNQQSVVIGDPASLGRMLKITVLKLTGSVVQLGFEVPDHVPVHRWEVWQRIVANGSVAASTGCVAPLPES